MKTKDVLFLSWFGVVAVLIIFLLFFLPITKSLFGIVSDFCLSGMISLTVGFLLGCVILPFQESSQFKFLLEKFPMKGGFAQRVNNITLKKELSNGEGLLAVLSLWLLVLIILLEGFVKFFFTKYFTKKS